MPYLKDLRDLTVLNRTLADLIIDRFGKLTRINVLGGHPPSNQLSILKSPKVRLSTVKSLKSFKSGIK